ncbi:pseudoazurin [Actibacterium sp. MT2.3-13A]|uniref:pseudoazurin n=1 Tax=Actibacterium sp. MT2.3-13A TaxID=2828332 RepID=UPI001BAA7AAD|nr:pseudoazurin [Actibacterium sp. MT2.3-13A]
MTLKSMILTAALALAAGTAGAETFEIQLRNKGEAGMMVFQPSFVTAQPGDVIHFVPVDKGHNVESIEGMLPEGVEAFKTNFDEEFTLTVEAEGLYGVKCTPHYALGMVALIQVGAATNLEAAQAVKQKGKARGRFQELLAQVQ